MYYIYKIENLINHKTYIGLTNNIIRRKSRHFSDLRNNTHDNSFLQKEFNIYGEKNFSFEVIFEADITSQEISDKERFYIKKYDSYRNGYNQNEGGNFGPSNGGTHLIKTDVLNILSVLEFMSRPGEILSQIFDVSKTTISRIKQGINHCEYKEYYDSLPLTKRKEIFEQFCNENNLKERKYNTTIIQSKRKLTKEQIFLIWLNEEKGRLVTIDTLCKKLNIKSSNTIYTILKHKSYQDFSFEYQKLTDDQKEKLVSLLSN